MVDFVNLRAKYFIASGIIILAGLIGQFISPDLRWGIEFSSGVTATIEFDSQVTEDDIKNTLSQIGYTDAIVQSFSDGSFFIRLPASENLESQRGEILGILEEKHGISNAFEFTAVELFLFVKKP